MGNSKISTFRCRNFVRPEQNWASKAYISLCFHAGNQNYILKFTKTEFEKNYIFLWNKQTYRQNPLYMIEWPSKLMHFKNIISKKPSVLTCHVMFWAYSSLKNESFELDKKKKWNTKCSFICNLRVFRHMVTKKHGILIIFMLTLNYLPLFFRKYSANMQKTLGFTCFFKHNICAGSANNIARDEGFICK